MPAPAQLVIGPLEHGVVRYAMRIADAVARLEPRVAVIRSLGVDQLATPTGRVHLHVTDRLFGRTAIEAAEAIERLSRSCSLTITLHDLPQPSDGPGRFDRRRTGYRRIIDAATAVACNSRHEASLIEEHLDVDRDSIAVMPLPVTPRASGDRPPVTIGDVAVLGFIYPGKGHEQVIVAVDTLSRSHPATVPDLSSASIRVVALGGPSPGHEDEAATLHVLAETHGVDFSTTGFLPDDELLTRCRQAGIPVVALQHVSASGSTATWIEAGRRPLVPDSRYAREIDTLRPGTVTLYEPSRLASALAEALRDPVSTWLEDGVDTRPHLEDTVDAYMRWWSELERDG